MRDRAQLYTLEGTIAGLVVLLGLFFALQATTATPGAAGSVNPHVEQQDRAAAESLLASMDDRTLRTAVLFWDDGEDEFHCAPGSSAFYPGVANESCSPYGESRPVPPNEFGELLGQHFGGAHNYNVVVTYHEPSGPGDFGQQYLVFQGQPGTGATRSSTSVVLTDDQSLYDVDGNPTGTTVGSDPGAFYAPDAASSDDFYNVVHVEVVVWRT